MLAIDRDSVASASQRQPDAAPAQPTHSATDAAAQSAIDSSRQLGVVNPERLAQQVSRAQGRDPAGGAALAQAVRERLDVHDRTSFDHELDAELGAAAGASAARAAGPRGVPDLRYPNADQAADAALSKGNPASIRANTEYGGLVFRDAANGQYFASKPVPGTGTSFDPSAVPVPPNAQVAGDYHTHGDYSTADANGDPVRTGDPAHDAYNSDNFSRSDLRGITADAVGKPGYNGYLGTPSGTLRKFDPASQADASFRARATGDFATGLGPTAGAAGRGGLVGAGAGAVIGTAQALAGGHLGRQQAGQIAGDTVRGGAAGAAYAVTERAAANAGNRIAGNTVQRAASSIANRLGSADAGAVGATARTLATRLGGAGVAGAVISAGFSAYQNREGLMRGDSKAIGNVAGDATVGAGAALAGAAAGAAIGSIVPVAGTAVGAVVGLGVGFAADYVMRAGGVDKVVGNAVSAGVDAAKGAAHTLAGWVGL
ncbi:MAG: DUF4329 domain-containing protein [Vitreoscilla sp.]